jgi:hypothetical protein
MTKQKGLRFQDLSFKYRYNKFPYYIKHLRYCCFNKKNVINYLKCDNVKHCEIYDLRSESFMYRFRLTFIFSIIIGNFSLAILYANGCITHNSISSTHRTNRPNLDTHSDIFGDTDFIIKINGKIIAYTVVNNTRKQF